MRKTLRQSLTGSQPRLDEELPIEGVSLRTASQLEFSLQSGAATYHLRAKSTADFERWVGPLKECVVDETTAPRKWSGIQTNIRAISSNNLLRGLPKASSKRLDRLVPATQEEIVMP